MSNITIYDVLRSLSAKRKEYVKWRFGLWRPADKIRPSTEEELMKKIDVKSLEFYREWEKSPEFKHILSLVLQMRQAEDLEQIYEKVKERVTNDPQPKDVELMLKLQKEISEHHKQAQAYFGGDE
jgi:hypothetical protein